MGMLRRREDRGWNKRDGDGNTDMTWKAGYQHGHEYGIPTGVWTTEASHEALHGLDNRHRGHDDCMIMRTSRRNEQSESFQAISRHFPTEHTPQSA